MTTSGQEGTVWHGIDGMTRSASTKTTMSTGISSQPDGIVAGTPQPPQSVPHLPVAYYSSFLSDEAKARKPSPIRSLYPVELIPGMISLLAGKPSSATFPFTSFQFSARSPSGAEQQLSILDDDLALSLQYTASAGIPRLVAWLEGLQSYAHGRGKDEGWRVSVGCGSTDLIYKAVHAVVNPGDTVLLESPTYSGTIPMFQGRNCEIIEVKTDADGVRSGDLRSILETWPANKPKPKLFYTVPYGCNPTGMTATVERRKEVLALAKEHEFIIFEDDPYYYLYYGESQRPASYFSLERTELGEVGRVLRFDSFSKILSAGIRLGFASGPLPLLNAIDAHTTLANLQVSSLTQMIAAKLLESWGYEGFMAHTEYVSQFYREMRDMFERAMNKHLQGLVEWTSPQSGMFIWFKILLTPPGSELKDGIEGDSEALIRSKAVERGVLAMPGTSFLPNGAKTAYVRASFSMNTEERTNEALKRLRDVILEARSAPQVE